MSGAYAPQSGDVRVKVDPCARDTFRVRCWGYADDEEFGHLWVVVATDTTLPRERINDAVARVLDQLRQAGDASYLLVGLGECGYRYYRLGGAP